VNLTGFLEFMLGAAETTNSPEVATAGIVTVIEVSLHELIVTGVAFSVTTLPPCEAPKLEPVITTWLPISPVVAETLVMTGAAPPPNSRTRLSKVAVARLVVLPLSRQTTYTFVPC